MGRRGPPRRRKAPLSVRSAAARPLRSGNSEQLLESLACPASRCALASQVCRLMKRGTEVLVSTRGPHCPPLPFPCQSFRLAWEAPPSRSPRAPWCWTLRPPVCRVWRAPSPPHSARSSCSLVFHPGWCPSQAASRRI